jgi:hypothetical protein
MAWFARRFVSPERQLDECGEDDDRDDAEIPAEEQHCEAFRLHVSSTLSTIIGILFRLARL